LGDLAGRLYGLELLIGPYAVAHFRLRHALAQAIEDPDTGAPVAVDLPRLGVYLADTLAAPNAAAPAGPLGFVAQGIQDERTEANRIKSEQPILAIIGNPPYRRLEEGENETLVGRWMDGVWDDLKKPVRDAGKGNQLNTFPELSVAFWRWAIWKLFESDNAPRRGVVAFITNRKFLTGWPYAGLRKMMRERFDRIEIVDLRGDVRAGVRGDVHGDQGVFNIMVGTAITIAVADGSKAEGALAEVTYNDSWERNLFSRRAKLDWLHEGAETGALVEGLPVQRSGTEDFRPKPFENGEWMSLPEAFKFWKSGMKSGSDLTFVAVEKRSLAAQVAPRLARRDNPAHDSALESGLAYRPLDRRWYYADLSLLQRPGPAMHRAWGAANIALYSMPAGTGAGPATWCVAEMADYHAFSGRGGYAFPLYDRREGPDATNVSPALLAALGAAYGEAVSPQDAFDAILCLLSTTSYTRRFAEDLEDVFPHIPFPATRAVFMDAVGLGREIRAVETFARAPEARFRPATLARQANHLTGAPVAPVAYTDGEITLCADGSGRLTGIPQAVWEFAVSGYRVLPRWIEGRAGLPADLAFVRELRDIAARIAELIHRFDEADLVLDATLADTLTREELGFLAPAQAEEEADEPDG
jgi:predicted helicase